MTDETDDLTAQLGGPAPEGVAALPDKQRRLLADALREARHNQARALATAGEESLKYVPAPLRGAVRKAVGL